MLSNKEELIDLFTSAKCNEEVNYICVTLEFEDEADISHTESIVFHRREFDYKLNYYLSFYDDDLRLKTNENVRIKNIMSCTNVINESVRLMYTF